MIGILLCILIVEVAVLIWRVERHAQPVAPFLPDSSVSEEPELIRRNGPTPMVELLCRAKGGDWQHHSWRPQGHRDITEALATPGLAIRGADGIKEGQQ